MIFQTRPAMAPDAEGMSIVLKEVVRLWKSNRPHGPVHIRNHYIEHLDKISCTIALDEIGGVVGFQSLKLARAGNSYGVEPGWGIIGSYVRVGCTGQGIGRLLFRETRDAARDAGIPSIDATIGANNQSGLAFYEALGFATYLTRSGIIRKRCDVV